MSFWRSFYHLIWATKAREPLLARDRLEIAARAVQESAQGNQTLIHAIGGSWDHVHVVASIPPKHAVSYVVGQMKGASTRAINASGMMPGATTFAWQSEYGVLTFGEKALDDVCRYVNDQERRHADGNVIALLERLVE